LRGPAFTSVRERRLWALTGAAVLAIYLTLGVARSLSDWLVAQELLGAAFFAGMAGVFAGVVLHGWSRRPRPAEVGLLVALAAAWMFVPVRMLSGAERSHLIEYAAVSLLADAALRERRDNGVEVPVPAVLAVLFGTLVGVLDELIQAVLPNRVCDPADMLFDGLASALAVGSHRAVAWVRARTAGGGEA